ncbi:hypothetical protein EBU99_04020 [bacterium]|nr:hypothetical protein [bacterium]
MATRMTVFSHRMKWLGRIAFLFVCLSFSNQSLAQTALGKDPRCPALNNILSRIFPIHAETFVMEELTLTGLRRTSEDFVRQEIGFEAGCVISIADAEAAAQRLRNTNFFLSVELTHEKISPTGIRLHFNFEEKWTLTPVLRGGSGGGVSFLVVGLYDLNAFGAGVETGAQYEQYAGAPGVSMWWRDPHVVTRDWRLAIDFSEVSRPVFFVNPDNDIYYTPLARLTRFSVMGIRRIANFEVGLGIEPLERYLLSEDFIAPKNNPNFSRRYEIGVNLKSTLRLNNLDLLDFRNNGSRFELNIEGLIPTSASVAQIVYRVSALEQLFWAWGRGSNLGLRLQVIAVSSESLLSAVRLGSLDGVRGLLEGERIGRYAWNTNVEYRWTSLLTPLWALQNVIFCDGGNTSETLSRWVQPVAISVGTGLRLGFRPIARLRLRVDYALAVVGLRQRQSWIAGMQQYF